MLYTGTTTEIFKCPLPLSAINRSVMIDNIVARALALIIRAGTPATTALSGTSWLQRRCSDGYVVSCYTAYNLCARAIYIVPDYGRLRLAVLNCLTYCYAVGERTFSPSTTRRRGYRQRNARCEALANLCFHICQIRFCPSCSFYL